MATVISAGHIFVTAMQEHAVSIEDMPRWGSPIWVADQVIEPAIAQVQRPGGVPFDASAVAIAHSLFAC
jgi:hypothetical protein